MNPTTPNLSPAAVKAAEEIRALVVKQRESSIRGLVPHPKAAEITAIITRHIAPLVEVAEAAKGFLLLLEMHEQYGTKVARENMEAGEQQLRAALEKVKL